MILTRDELLKRVQEYVGEDTSDSALSFVQDLTETIKADKQDDYKQKYEENDAMWRKRYRDAFFSEKPETLEGETEPEDKKSPETFNELFTEVKK